jgi:hypothetical protein
VLLDDETERNILCVYGTERRKTQHQGTERVQTVVARRLSC